MFTRQTRRSGPAMVFGLLRVIYHATVREARKSSRNAVAGLLSRVFTAILMVVAFYLMFSLLNLRGMALRGDFIVYLMTGIFLFLTHNQAVRSVMNAEGPTSAMMKHAPMNTIVSISAAALSSLYMQLLALGVIFFGVHVAWRPVEIDDPVGLMHNFMLAWSSGAAIGVLLLALKPWFPSFVRIVSMVYMRANMITSGKMFVANTLPASMLPFFSWNPLFHTIDQARGAAFINYNPHNTNETYPLLVTITLIMLGLMGEFYTRRRASLSWDAAR
ncbi:ABC transporter permease [Maritimibacter sp. 55A14]|uniref:ABC transporter permease n=1 Tax=Maritimibacter sp. 55A14 TaxID=2174844 RepID=UPI000D603C25|nr:ABC transporter permease [Maritimibacter sp. 55A14]PWE33581.1 ABC transporter permease [Maritimibacter sp. 55A14]